MQNVVAVCTKPLVGQRQLIRSTWPRIVTCDADFEQIGVEVFVRIFSRHPELIALFPFGDELDLHNGKATEMTTDWASCDVT